MALNEKHANNPGISQRSTYSVQGRKGRLAPSDPQDEFIDAKSDDGRW